MKWLDNKISLYNSVVDNIGCNDFTFREILFTKFATPHKVYDKDLRRKREVIDLETISKLRELDKGDVNYEKGKKYYKSFLHGFTPSGLLKTREKDKVVVLNYSGILQLDFDKEDNLKWDMEKLKIEVFKYPFVAFVGKSCSGDGFYALIAIAEPEKLKQYALQIFEVFERHGIILDTSKGKNVHDLRFLSYDPDMLFREDPTPLKINSYYKENVSIEEPLKNAVTIKSPVLVVEYWMRQLRACVQGERMKTIQKVAVSLGSKRDRSYLTLMLDEISSNGIFEDDREEFLKSAEKLFEWGWNNPLQKDLQAQIEK